MAAVDDALAALASAGLTAYDTEPSANPPAGYVLVSDRDPGHAWAHRATPTHHWTTITIDVRAVARTLNGLRDLLADVRAALAGRRISPRLDPLRELEASPYMVTGPIGDQRHEALIAYRTTTATEGAIRP